MALEVQWSKRADRKFDKIIEYLLIEWSERVTRAFIKKVYDLIETLSDRDLIRSTNPSNKIESLNLNSLRSTINASSHFCLFTFFVRRSFSEGGLSFVSTLKSQLSTLKSQLSNLYAHHSPLSTHALNLELPHKTFSILSTAISKM